MEADEFEICRVSDKLKIVSWNIMFNHPQPLSKRISNIKKLIPTDTDVICFQEVLHTDVELIEDIFTMFNVIVIPYRAYGQLILVKKDIAVVESTIIPLVTKMGRVANKITILWEGSPDSDVGALRLVDIFTFHLESMPYNAEARMNQMVEISKFIEQDRITVLCGDTNMLPKEVPLFGRGVLDVAVLLKDEQPTYFGGRFGKYNSQKRYDKVFISSFYPPSGYNLDSVLNLEYIKCNGDAPESDHDGLIVIMSLSN